MISSVNNTASLFPPNSIIKADNTPLTPSSSSFNFDIEDKAIISAEAKLLNAAEQYNAGKINEVDVALESTLAVLQTKASCNVIKAKEEMFDSLINAF